MPEQSSSRRNAWSRLGAIDMHGSFEERACSWKGSGVNSPPTYMTNLLVS